MRWISISSSCNIWGYFALSRTRPVLLPHPVATHSPNARTSDDVAKRITANQTNREQHRTVDDTPIWSWFSSFRRQAFRRHHDFAELPQPESLQCSMYVIQFSVVNRSYTQVAYRKALRSYLAPFYTGEFLTPRVTSVSNRTNGVLISMTSVRCKPLRIFSARNGYGVVFLERSDACHFFRQHTSLNPRLHAPTVFQDMENRRSMQPRIERGVLLSHRQSVSAHKWITAKYVC